ncbi:MAG: transposase [Pirellulales bacterium]|jgi:hypothetical protein|nr:transposase [Pirellulales bacterium]
MAKSQRDAAKEGRWRDFVKRHAASGLSVREFCRRESLTESAFYAWRRTIGERDEARHARRRAPAFVPAVVTEESRHEGSIALELAGGGVLRFVGPAAAEHLADLVVALQSRAAR